MARHIMAVCVVCLLCVDHLPCQEHFDNELIISNQHNNYDKSFKFLEHTKVFDTLSLNNNYATGNSIINNHNNNINKNAQEKVMKQRNNREKVNSNKFSKINNAVSSNSNNIDIVRLKRHANHNHLDNDIITKTTSLTTNDIKSMPKITQKYLQQLFDEYGTKDGTINLNNFQDMLRRLGLIQYLQQDDHLQNPSHTKAPKYNENEMCMAETSLLHLIQKHQELPLTDGSSVHNTTEFEPDLKQKDILYMCPVLLYQLSSTNATTRSGCISQNIAEHMEARDSPRHKKENQNMTAVWIYAFVAVLACSILGLVGVAIIPFMDSRYYKHIIHFLVALAIGTMTGDALLHLLPHSLAGQSEQNMIYKGLVCMSGIIFFYITEHGLTMISEWRKHRAKQEIENNKWQVAKVMREPDSTRNASSNVSTAPVPPGEKVCKSKYSSYPYCYDEIAMDMLQDVWLHLPKNANNALAETVVDTANNIKQLDNNDVIKYERNRNGKKSASLVSASDPAEIAAVQSLLHNYSESQHRRSCPCVHHMQAPQANHKLTKDERAVRPSNGNTIEGNIEARSCECNIGNCGDASHLANNLEEVTANKAVTQQQRENEPVTVILREHEATHHGHSHKHGHVHSPPESLSAVAWMIIMGDGLHNFTDGMAIGAAFAENIAGGFSTALAVFCHELPHELGDFAILMKAGMSVKSAVFYNLLTGVLSFIGMIFGIAFGQSQETAQWMFAAAAGLFIYIALVDMMPEISAAHKSIYEFVLQILGISTGVALMLLIAIFEGELMNVFPAQ